MEVKEVTIQAIDLNNLKPEDVFTWLELFSFKRYGVRHHLDPSKTDDPRYPSECDESPVDWYTHLGVPSQYYDRNCIIIDEERYEQIKAAFRKANEQEDHHKSKDLADVRVKKNV
jgi:hypothetical protein